MPAMTHLLTGAGGDLCQVGIVCGARDAACATWSRAAVNCPRCLAPAAPHRSRTPPALTEEQWLAQVRALATQHDWLTYHPLRSQGSEPGWPDLACLKPPRLVLAELKTDRGRLTPAQQHWLTALQQVTTIATHLWRPEHWETVVQVLVGSHAPII